MRETVLPLLLLFLVASTCSAEVLVDQNVKLGDDGDFFKITYSKTFNVDKVPENPVLVFEGVYGVERMSDWKWYSYDDVILNGQKLTTMNYIAGSPRIQFDKSIVRKGSNTLEIHSGKTNYIPEDEAYDDFTITSIKLVEGAPVSLKLSYADKKLKAAVKNKNTGNGISGKKVTFNEDFKPQTGPSTLTYLGEKTTDAAGVAELPYDPADKTKPKTIIANEEGGASDTLVITFGEGALKGRITDGHGNPMPYIKITVKFDGQEFPGRSDKDGNYEIKIKDFNPDNANPKEVKLKIEFTYELGGKNYYTVIDEFAGGKLVWLEKKFKLKTEADKTQNIDFNLAPRPELSSSGDINNLKHFAPIYFHMHQAVDFALNKLKANIDFNLPVDVKVGSASGTSYNGQTSTIFINTGDVLYSDTDRPKNREYHEFGHHIMYANYGAWPADWSTGATVNHNGYINPKTDDSYLEGFAEFMALLTAEYAGDPHPEIYASFGSLETNYKVWSNRGYNEELAIAGLFWDLYDKNNGRDDKMSLDLDKMWDVLKVKRSDLFEYYKAFKAQNADKAGDVDIIFVSHGVFADKNPGNGRWDRQEPFIDANGDGTYTAGEKFVDYAMVRGSTVPFMKYDIGEEIGRATNYNRTNRSMAGRVPNAYLKVSDKGVQNYKVQVHFKDPEEGADYEYTVDVREGKVYINPLPDDIDAVITVKPDSKDYTASSIYTISTQDYLDKFYNTPANQGYCDSHTFGLKPTGTHLDEPYETIEGATPSYESKGDELGQGGDKPQDNGGKGGGPFSCCLPALPAMLALSLSLIMGIPYAMETRPAL